jgi:hypothetical protein
MRDCAHRLRGMVDSMRRQGRWRVRGLWAVLAAFALTPAVASAGTPGQTERLGKSKGIEYMRAKYLDVVTQTTQPVTCDGDAEVAGGGGSISGPAGTATVNESYPMPQSGWGVEGSRSAGSSRTLNGYAMCVGTDVEFYFTSENVGNGSISNGAGCILDELPTGGGLESTSSGMFMNFTRPETEPAARWYSLAQNPTGSTIAVTYWTACSNRYKLRYRTTETAGIQPGEADTATAKCKPDEAVIGGGYHALFQGNDTTGVRPNATKPWDSKDDAKKVPDDGWRVKLFNEYVGKVRLVAHAVCVRGLQPL